MTAIQMRTTPLTTHDADRRVRPPTDPADAERLVGALARWYLEFLAGQRPVAQVVGLLSPAVVDRIQRRRHSVRDLDGRRPSAPGPAVVRSIQLQWTNERTCEATALVVRGPRTTAIAMTLHRRETSWRVVELSSPEDGVEALRCLTPVG